MKCLYLDTSAVLRLFLRQESWKRIQALLQSSLTIVSSRLLRVETYRALVRFRLDDSRNEHLIPVIVRQLGSFWPRVDFIEITKEICDRAESLAPASRLRALDAIHLATFQRIREVEPDARMLTFDGRLLAEIGELAVPDNEEAPS